MIAFFLGTVLGALVGAGVMALAAIAGHYTRQEETAEQVHIAYSRGYRNGLDEANQ